LKRGGRRPNEAELMGNSALALDLSAEKMLTVSTKRRKTKKNKMERAVVDEH
jgi:hypothetical protein